MLTPHSLRKIMQPGLPPTILHREKLVHAFSDALATDQQAGYKLVLLCAPAGYGKTTLLVDFAHHSSLPCCWYFLDRSDTDKIMFMRLLIASIRQRFPSFGASLDTQITHWVDMNTTGSIDIRHLETWMDTCIAAIEADITERFVLMLCNYHEVNGNQAINTLVNRLLLHLPAQCVLVIESRAIPTLELAPLIAHRQMIGFGSNSLSFTAQDIRNLTNLLGLEALSEEEAERLTASFDGWITGILLGTRLGDGQALSPQTRTDGPCWVFSALCMDRENLFAYLVNEVFKREPETYAFLQDTSILQQMTPALCNALLSTSDADARLSYAEQQGLFVTRSGDSSQPIYICHPTLRELFCADLQRRDQERLLALHRRAADFFYAAQEYDAAISHALHAEANDFAADLITIAARPMLQQGHLETIIRWIDALPASTLEQDPQLLLTRAKIHLTKYETAQAKPLLERAYALITCDPPLLDRDIVPIIQAEILIVRSIVFFNDGEYLQVQQACQEALALLPADERTLRAMAYQRLGACSCLLGDCTAGIAQMQQALRLWGHNTEVSQTAFLHSSLANAYNMVGNYGLSEHHRARAIHINDYLGDIWSKINNLIGMSNTKRYKGALDEAEATLMQALTMARETHFQSGEAYALINLGELYQDQACYEKALAAAEDGLALARQLQDNYLTNCTLCVLASTYLMMGDADTALLLVEETTVKAGDMTSYEWTLRELTRGIIFFFQHNYAEASACLSAVEGAVHHAGMKRLLVRAIIYQAACHLAQGQPEQAMQYMEKVAAIPGDHEHTIQVEQLRLPELRRAMQSMSRAAQQKDTPSQRPPSLDVNTSSAPRLRILALGEPAVVVEETPITRWRMARSMELYFFLLDYGRPVRREQIITALWPDADDHIEQTLRSTIYYLRKALGESCIVYRSGTYILDLASLYGEHTWYDVAAFRQCYAQAKDALAAEDDAAAREALQEMIAVYHGDYVQSFYSDWCIMRRDELRHIYLDARRQLALIAWRQGQFNECIVHWQQMLAVDSCLEEAHYGVMRCHMRQGKRGLALRQYQRCATILRDEMSVSPGAAIQKLHQRLTGNMQE